MDAPPSEGDTRSDSDDDFRTRHTAGTCGGADTLVGEPLHGAEGRAHPCRDSRPADGAFQVHAGEMVKVIKGPLAGMEGELVNVDGRSKVVVRLEMLGCAGVDMPVGFVEAMK